MFLISNVDPNMGLKMFLISNEDRNMGLKIIKIFTFLIAFTGTENPKG